MGIIEQLEVGQTWLAMLTAVSALPPDFFGKQV